MPAEDSGNERVEPQTDASAPDLKDVAEPEASREKLDFTLTCSSLDRVLLVIPAVVCPLATGRLLVGIRDIAAAGEKTVLEFVSANGPLYALSLIAIVVGSILALVFCPLYLQYRAKSQLTLDAEGMTFAREAILPFGWLGRQARLSWVDLHDVRYQYRFLPIPAPTLTFRSPDTLVNVNVSQLWPADDEERPIKNPVPKGGWQEHQAAVVATERFISSRAELANRAKKSKNL